MLYHDTRVDTRYKNTCLVSHLVKKLVHDNTHREVRMKKKRSKVFSYVLITVSKCELMVFADTRYDIQLAESIQDTG